MNAAAITTIIDKHLKDWADKGLNKLPGAIAAEMTNADEPMNEDGWQTWYAINSTISDTEIEDLEKLLKTPLPYSYKIFLKHKHFYELYISEARFSGMEIREWKKNFTDMVFDGYPREFLFDKGCIPFADWNDWGLLCFDTNKTCMDNEYPVILWDHERWDKFEAFSENFYSLLLRLDKESEADEF